MKKVCDSYKKFWIILFVGLIFDQTTKYFVIKNISNEISYFKPIQIVKNFLYLVHIHNSGAAWGIFSGKSHVLAVIGVIALILIFVFRNSFELKKMQLSFGCLISGILGNLIDRVFRGHVIDFIDVHLWSYRWPAFNVADSMIFLGITIYLLSSYKKSNCS